MFSVGNIYQGLQNIVFHHNAKYSKMITSIVFNRGGLCKQYFLWVQIYQGLQMRNKDINIGDINECVENYNTQECLSEKEK